jgi:hypothetical protein
MIEEEYYDSGIPYQENIKGIASMVTFPFTYASMQRAVSPPTIRGQPFLENLKMAISTFRSK